MSERKIIFVSALVLGFLAFINCSPAEIRNVPADYLTIQAGIDNSNDGDTVLVAPGTYTGDGNRDIDLKGKAITVRSEDGPESCIIQCGGRYPAGDRSNPIEPEYHRGFHFHSHEDANSIVQGFTITKGYMDTEDGGAILCVDSSPSISDCIIKDNAASALLLVKRWTKEGLPADMVNVKLTYQQGAQKCQRRPI